MSYTCQLDWLCLEKDRVLPSSKTMWLVVKIPPFLGNDIIGSKHDITPQHLGDVL